MQLGIYMNSVTTKHILQFIIIHWFIIHYDTSQALSDNNILPLLHAAKIIIFL